MEILVLCPVLKDVFRADCMLSWRWQVIAGTFRNRLVMELMLHLVCDRKCRRNGVYFGWSPSQRQWLDVRTEWSPTSFIVFVRQNAQGMLTVQLDIDVHGKYSTFL